MKNSKIEWVGEIPENWEVKPIRALFVENNNKNVLGKETKALQFKFGEIVPKKNFNAADDEYVADTILKYNIVDKDMIVINGLNLNFDFVTKRVGLVKERGIITSAYMSFYIKDKKSVSPNYANYLLKSYDNCTAFHNMGGGVRKILTFEELKHNLFLLPPLTEQKEIAEYLDEKCGEIDALLADIKDEIETLEQYKRSVITESVTKGLNPSAPMKNSGIEWLGDQPIHWEHFKGKYIFKQRNERGNQVKLQLLSPTQNYGVIPQTLYEELSGMSAVKLNENINLSILKTIHKGDFCISLRSFQGGFEYSQYEGVVSPAYQVFYPTKKIFDGYYKYLFKEKSFIAVMNSYTLSLRDGKNIAFSDFGNTLIPYPPLSEQQEIAEYLDKKCAEIDEVISDKQTEIQTLESYKKSLIYEYVTGKKEVKCNGKKN